MNKGDVIITGASSGIGLSICKKMVEEGYLVYGIGRDFQKTDYSDENFIQVKIDLSDIRNIEKNLLILDEKIHNLKILIHSAGFGVFGLHEELNSKEIENMISVNLTAPILLTKYYLRDLKKNKGSIVSISSVTAKKSSPLAAAYSATKAGLTQFNESIFEESRKSGLKIINIHPDITKTNFYNNTWFCEETSDEESYLISDEIANAVLFSIQQRSSVVIKDITIVPQKHRILRKKGGI